MSYSQCVACFIEYFHILLDTIHNGLAMGILTRLASKQVLQTTL